MTKSTATRKKLIEVSIPLEAINRESAREKQIKVGKPASLHNYWAPRPLAANRAIIFAQLVDDPGSCPEEFPTKEAQDTERERLHRLIEKLVQWEAPRNETIINEARYEIARSVARGRGEKLPDGGQMRPQQIIDYLQDYAPLVYDPFTGGGLIPLEAQRLGLRAVGTDLNPVAVLISKALVEFPPKFAGRKPANPEVDELRQWMGAQGMADDVRYYGRWMQVEADKKIGHLYPKIRLKDGKEATVIAWLWARTVPSPDPRANGAHVPLASSFVLSAKAGKEVIVKPLVDRSKMTWTFEVNDKPSVSEVAIAKNGTKEGNGFRCLITGAPMKFADLRDYGKNNKFGARLMAVVAEGNRQRIYCSPQAEQEELALRTRAEWRPDQPMDGEALGFRVPEYGIDTWGDLFTERQLVALTTFADLVAVARDCVYADAKKNWVGQHRDDVRRLTDGGEGPAAYADAIGTYLGFAVDRSAQTNAMLCRWVANIEKLQPCFDQQTVSMVWDAGEANIFGRSTGSWQNTMKHLANTLETWGSSVPGSQIFCKDAAKNDFPTPCVVATDRPYYDNIGYADLSDFFYVWLRRALSALHPDLFRRVLTPKSEELVATPSRHGGKAQADAFFIEGMKMALAGIARASAQFPATIYYAFKQSEVSNEGVTSAGWASFLQAVFEGGLAIDATWPMRSEHSSRSRSQNSNALASAVVLVCRRRHATASTITRADFLRALRREMPAALAEIRRAGVGPTDIQQAAIGPGIGVFTRYLQVLNTDGTPIPVKDALKLINQVREEITSTSDADYDSETRFALDWFAAKGFDKGKSGDAIVMTNAVNVSLDGMNAVGFFEARGGDARLLKRNELPDDWDPAADTRGTVWEACQHLVKRLTAEDGGIDAAAALYNRLGALAEPAHALARRLYDICEQKQWASEGRVYNQLHQEWAVIEKRAAELAEVSGARDLFSR